MDQGDGTSKKVTCNEHAALKELTDGGFDVVVVEEVDDGVAGGDEERVIREFKSCETRIDQAGAQDRFERIEEVFNSFVSCDD